MDGTPGVWPPRAPVRATPEPALLTIHQHDIPWIDPHQAAAAFAGLARLVLLDSCGPIGPASRYAALCIDPYAAITGADPDPLCALDTALAPWRMAPDPDFAGFRGGAAGFIGYEFGAAREAVVARPASPDDPPDIAIGLYDLVIGFDRERRLCRIFATGLPEISAHARAARAERRITWALSLLAAPPRSPAALPALHLDPAWTRAEYAARLRRLLGYIVAGDIFQANLTMRFEAPRPQGLDDWDVHAALRARSPAPFGAWLRWDGFTLCCASPERFIRLAAYGVMTTSPIKGTSARDTDPARDAAAAAALQASLKDRAENVMIVDVLRNDLGRVAEIGSVAVPELCGLRSYANVHHLVSTITARLRAGLGAADVLRAALPGGSITGAPKIRAMQIIAELEQSRRGPYCGCVAALGFDGAMDSNIIIRSLLLTPRRVIAQAGGGIVADSNEDAEYDEMMLKSAPMRAIFAPK